MIVNCSKILKHGIQKFDNHDIRKLYTEQSYKSFYYSEIYYIKKTNGKMFGMSILKRNNGIAHEIW